MTSTMLPIFLCMVAAYAGLFCPITVAMPRFAASIISFLTASNIKGKLEGVRLQL